MITDVAGRSRSDENFEHLDFVVVSQIEVCLRNHMKLRWSFEIEREIGGGRPRTLKQTASVDLVLVTLLIDQSFSLGPAYTGLSYVL